MKYESRIDELSSGFFADASIDYIQLWLLLARVRDKFPEKSAKDQQAITIMIIKKLMTQGLLVFNFHKDQNGSWSKSVWKDQDPESVGVRIDREWAMLPGDPGLGDICWLMLPCPEGKASNA